MRIIACVMVSIWFNLSNFMGSLSGFQGKVIIKSNVLVYLMSWTKLMQTIDDSEIKSYESIGTCMNLSTMSLFCYESCCVKATLTKYYISM